MDLSRRADQFGQGKREGARASAEIRPGATGCGYAVAQEIRVVRVVHRRYRVAERFRQGHSWRGAGGGTRLHLSPEEQTAAKSLRDSNRCERRSPEDQPEAVTMVAAPATALPAAEGFISTPPWKGGTGSL